MTVSIALRSAFNVTPAHQRDAEGLEDHIWDVADALSDLEDVPNPSIHSSAVSADLANRSVIIEVVATGSTYAEAEECGRAAMRSAIHAAYGQTNSWGRPGQDNPWDQESVHSELLTNV